MYNIGMIYTTFISTRDLAPHLTDPDWAVFDCRFSLADPERGRRDYLHEHIPGAVYAHLNEDLSGPIVPGKTGRHPLPAVEFAAGRFSAWGIDDRVQVIAYDDAGGGIAARLWWLLHWLGHDAVAVLDGGWPQWRSERRAVRSSAEWRAPRKFAPRPRPELVVTTAEVMAQSGDPKFRLIDARTAERYLGQNEPIDPVAGHIPGAINAPYSDNLSADGMFWPADELRARYIALLGDVPADHATFYCGSGVNATQSILALKHAGLGDARLYAGSWSEWITDPGRPVEK